MRSRILQFAIIQTQHNRFDLAFGGRGNQYLFGSAFQVLGSIVVVGKAARAFDDQIHAQVAPRQFGGVFFGKGTDAAVANGDAFLIGRYRFRVFAVRRVIFEQVGEGGVIGQIVESYNFNARVGQLQKSTGDQAANPTKTVDCNFFSHEY